MIFTYLGHTITTTSIYPKVYSVDGIGEYPTLRECRDAINKAEHQEEWLCTKPMTRDKPRKELLFFHPTDNIFSASDLARIFEAIAKYDPDAEVLVDMSESEEENTSYIDEISYDCKNSVIGIKIQ